jgi:hypothetical protein
VCGLKCTKKRRVNDAVMYGSLNGRCLYVGFGCDLVRCMEPS